MPKNKPSKKKTFQKRALSNMRFFAAFQKITLFISSLYGYINLKKKRKEKIEN